MMRKFLYTLIALALGINVALGNDYFTASGVPSTGAALNSATMRGEFTSIQTGFDKLPTLSGNGNKVVVVNSGGTALTATTSTALPNMVVGTNIQAWDADLDTLAALGNWKIAYTNGSGAQTALTVGADGLIFSGNGVTAAPSFRSLSSLGIQPLDTELTALASVTSAANKVPYFTGSGTATVADLSASGRSIINVAIAAKGDILAGSAASTATIVTVGANDTVLTADSAQTSGVKWVAVVGVPPGAMLDFAGLLASIPSGYLPCDGAAVSRSTYSTLFTAIGTTWGVGNGTTTFNVPDFSRRVAVGSGGSGTATLANSVGSTGGEETHTLTTAEMPAHTHSGAVAADTITPGVTAGGASGTTTGSTGGGGAHNIMQPSAVVLKIIKY